MAGPLGGIGTQQQLPIATALQQSGGANQVQRRDTQEQQQGQAGVQDVQPAGTPAVETQNVETQNEDVVSQQRDNIIAANSNADQAEGSEERGSLVDISV